MYSINKGTGDTYQKKGAEKCDILQRLCCISIGSPNVLASCAFIGDCHWLIRTARLHLNVLRFIVLTLGTSDWREYR